MSSSVLKDSSISNLPNSLSAPFPAKPVAKKPKLSNKMIDDKLAVARTCELTELLAVISKEHPHLSPQIASVLAKADKSISRQACLDLMDSLVKLDPEIKALSGPLGRFWPYYIQGKPQSDHALLNQCIVCQSKTSLLYFYQRDAPVCHTCCGATWTRMSIMGKFGFSKSRADKIKRKGMVNAYSGYRYAMKDIVKAVRQDHGSLFEYAKSDTSSSKYQCI